MLTLDRRRVDYRAWCASSTPPRRQLWAPGTLAPSSAGARSTAGTPSAEPADRRHPDRATTRAARPPTGRIQAERDAVRRRPRDARPKARDPCEGDAGGPLLVPDGSPSARSPGLSWLRTACARPAPAGGLHAARRRPAQRVGPQQDPRGRLHPQPPAARQRGGQADADRARARRRSPVHDLPLGPRQRRRLRRRHGRVDPAHLHAGGRGGRGPRGLDDRRRQGGHLLRVRRRAEPQPRPARPDADRPGHDHPAADHEPRRDPRRWPRSSTPGGPRSAAGASRSASASRRPRRPGPR